MTTRPYVSNKRNYLQSSFLSIRALLIFVYAYKHSYRIRDPQVLQFTTAPTEVPLPHLTMNSARLDELSPFPPDTYGQDEEDLSPTQNKQQDPPFNKPTDFDANEEPGPIDIVFIEDSEEERKTIKKDRQ